MVRSFEAELLSEQTQVGTDTLYDALCNCFVSLLALLRPDQADLLRRIDLGGDDRATVAAELGITRGTFGVRLHRARLALKNLLLAVCISCPKHGFDDCACHPGKMEKLASLTMN